MSFKILSCLVLLLFLLLSTTIANAQTVQISGFTDFAFGQWSGVGDFELSDTLCAYKSSGNDRYTVTPSGSGAGGAFELTSASSSISFEFYWRQIGRNYSKHNANQSRQHRGANKSSTTCGGTDNAEVRILLKESELDGALASQIYSGTVYVLVEPV